MVNLTKEEQIKKWNELYKKPISSEEFAEICTNLNGFFTTLKQWSDNEERMLAENGSDNKRGMLLPSPAK